MVDLIKTLTEPPPSSGAHVAIVGTGGIGKTSVALAVLHHPTIKGHFGVKCYFVRCETISSVDALISAVMILVCGHHAEEDPLTKILETLRRSGPTLLVLDNFETPYLASGSSSEDVQVILAQLAAVKSVSLMITMRGEAPSCVSWSGDFSIAVLSLEAARSTFLVKSTF